MSTKLTYDQVQVLLLKSLDRDFVIHTGLLLSLVDGYISKYGFTKDDFIFSRHESGQVMVIDILNTENKPSLK